MTQARTFLDQLPVSTTDKERIAHGNAELLTAPAVAGVAYLGAWLTGLAVWPSNLDVAAVALAIAVLALGQAARHRDAGSLAPATVVTGVGAAVVSLVQGPLGCCWPAGRSLTATAAGPETCSR